MKMLMAGLRIVVATLFLPALISIPSIGLSEELFPSGQTRPYKKFDNLDADATAGGFAIFQGGRPWRIVMANVAKNNMDVGISYLHMISPMGNDYFAEMAVTIALGGGDTSSGTYFGGEPCALNVDVLFRLNKGIGKGDNCLTIRPRTVKIQDKSLLTMETMVRNSQSSTRLYDITLLVALDKLGFPNSKDSDWTASQIENDPTKKQFIEKISTWGAQLQEAVNLALAFSKPLDIFQSVPSIDTMFAPKNNFEMKWVGIYTVSSESRIPESESLTGLRNAIKGVTLVKETTQIPAVLGTRFGVSYVINGGQSNELVSLRAIVRYPEGGLRNPESGKSATSSEWLQPCRVGGGCSVGYYFREQWELIPGEWSFEVWQGPQQLVNQKFTVHLP